MTEEKINHMHIYELVLHASYQIRKKLKIDDLSYNVCFSNANDPKKYYLHNVLNEVEKSVFSLMFACEFLDTNKYEHIPVEKDKQLDSKILQCKIDELSLWRRKLVEILIDLIGFRASNSLDYYRHYNILHEISRKQKEFSDRKEFWGCNNKNLANDIQYLNQNAEQLARQLDPKKCWYAKKKKNTKNIQSKLNSNRSCFIVLLQKAKNYQKALLLSYRNSFGKSSELLHPKRIVDERNVTLEDFSHAIEGVGVLGLYVISAVKDLLRIHNIKGSLKQVADAVKKNLYPISLLKLRTQSKILINDFVLTPFGPAQVKKTCKSKFGYKTFQVKFLISSDSSIKNEEYLAEEIQLLAPYKEIKQEVLRILQQGNSRARVGTLAINKAMNNQVLELWALFQDKMT